MERALHAKPPVGTDGMVYSDPPIGAKSTDLTVFTLLTPLKALSKMARNLLYVYPTRHTPGAYASTNVKSF